jgi:hypothetical protein
MFAPVKACMKYLSVFFLVSLLLPAAGQLPPGVEWMARFDAASPVNDEPAAMALGPDGAITVTGSSFETNALLGLTVRYDSAGNFLWSSRLKAPSSLLVVDSEGNSVSAGVIQTGQGSGTVYVSSINSNGVVSWTTNVQSGFNGAGADGLVLDSTNNIYSLNHNFNFDIERSDEVISLTPEGVIRWRKFTDRTRFAAGIAINGMNDIAVAGQSIDGDLELDGFSTAGTRFSVFVSQLSGPEFITSDGNSFYVYSHQKTTSRPCVSKFSRDLQLVWTSPLSDEARANFVVTIFKVDAAENIYLGGNRFSSGFYDFRIVKLNTLGETAWIRDYDGAAHRNDKIGGLAIDNAGSVYVAASSETTADDPDFLTIKHDASGKRLWALTNAGPAGADVPVAIQVTTDHQPVVAGSSLGTNGFTDFLVIKYGSLEDKIFVEAQIDGLGSVTKTPDKPFYDAGENLVLTAIPNQDEAFLRWIGAFTTTNAEVAITLQSNIVAVAQFSPAALLTLRCGGGEDCLTNLTMNLVGRRLARYEIQFSTNLTSWAPLTVVTNQENVSSIGPVEASARQKYYRALLLP